MMRAWLLLLLLLPGCAAPTPEATVPAPAAGPEPSSWSRGFNATRTLLLPAPPAALHWEPLPCDGSGADRRNVAAPVPAALRGDNASVARNVLHLLDDEVVGVASSEPLATQYRTRHGSLALNQGIVFYETNRTLFGTDAASLRADFELFLKRLGFEGRLAWPATGGRIALDAPGWNVGGSSVNLFQDARGGTTFQLVHLRSFGDLAGAVEPERAQATAARYATCAWGWEEGAESERPDVIAWDSSAAYAVGLRHPPGPCGVRAEGQVLVDAFTGAVLRATGSEPLPPIHSCPP